MTMRHLLLVAPLLALASACTEPCAAPTLTVSWRFTLADGSTFVRCFDAGVDTVDLWLDGVKVGEGMACEQGSATFALAAGAHAYTIRGLAADGSIRYQTWGEATQGSCGETRVTLTPGAGRLRVEYPTSTGSCASASDPATNGYVWYDLLDRTTGLSASSVNGAKTPTALPCNTGDQGWFEIPLAWGLYRLRWIQVVTSPLAASPTPIFQYCPPLSPTPDPPIDVDVITTGLTTMVVPVAPPTEVCIP